MCGVTATPDRRTDIIDQADFDSAPAAEGVPPITKEALHVPDGALKALGFNGKEEQKEVDPTHALFADVSEAGSPFASATITEPDADGRIFAETPDGRREVAWLESETTSGKLVFMDEVNFVCQELAKVDRARAAGLIPVGGLEVVAA